MRAPRLRFTVRGLMVAVAYTALVVGTFRIGTPLAFWACAVAGLATARALRVADDLRRQGRAPGAASIVGLLVTSALAATVPVTGGVLAMEAVYVALCPHTHMPMTWQLFSLCVSMLVCGGVAWSLMPLVRYRA